jgi:hypothetical protein
MRKEDLIKALVRRARSENAKAARRGQSNGSNGSKTSSRAASSANGSATNGSAKNGQAQKQQKQKSPRKRQRLSQMRAKLTQSKDLALTSSISGKQGGYTKDRLVVMVRDPYWLHAYWELTRQTVERARVAMGQSWHTAKPVLRLAEVSRDGTTNTARMVIRDIEIHGGVNNWYVDVQDPPKSYQLDIGYVSPDGKFFSLCRSNCVTTPQTNSVDPVDGNWTTVAQDFDRIFAMSGGYADKGDNGDLKDLFEERLHRPMGSPMVTRFGLGASAPAPNRRDFNFHVDAELVVHGVTEPGSHVTIKGEPVRLKPDGSFVVRFRLPDRRQVLPVVTSSCDGVEQRTIVLAVERNTKVMEPVIREPDT